MPAARRIDLVRGAVAIMFGLAAASCGGSGDGSGSADVRAASARSSTTTSSTSIAPPPTSAEATAATPETTATVLQPPPSTTARARSGATTPTSGGTSSATTTGATPTSAAPTTTAASTPPTTTAPAAKATIRIANFAYSPPLLQVTVGTDVEAVNEDRATHTWTADDAMWDSGNLGNGQRYTFRFTTAGTFPYHCTIHPSMKGTVRVEG